MKLFTKKKFLAIVTAIFAITESMIPVLAQDNTGGIQNLLINPGFEESAMYTPESQVSHKYGWYGGNGTANFNAIQSEIAHSGSWCAEWWGPHQSINQTVAVSPNKNYAVSFWYKSGGLNVTDVSTYDYVGVSFCAEDGTTKLVAPANPAYKSSYIYPPKAEWTKVDLTFNSGNNSKITLQIFHDGYASGVPCYFDDFVLGCIDPEIEDVYIDGYATVGNSISAASDVSDPVGDAIQESKYNWQISNSGQNGTWEDIAGADSAVYTVKEADAGKYIRVGATPVSKTSGGSYKYGTKEYSQAVLASAASNNIPIDISEMFTGLLIGSDEEAALCQDAADSIDGYVLNRDNIVSELNANNAYVYSQTAYSLSLHADKRAVRSGKNQEDLTVSLGNQNMDSVSVLMTYTQVPTAEQKAVIEYTDDTTTDITYTANDSAKCVNASPIGMFGTGENADDAQSGYLYSYTFDLDAEKEVKSITFPYSSTGDKLLIFAVTGEQVSGEVLSQIIENKISALPQTITLDNRSDVEKIMSFVSLYEENGGDADTITGYETVKTLLTGVQNHTPVSDLLDCTINIDFSNPVKGDTISKETITVIGLDKKQYEVEPVMSGEDVVGAKVTVINNFSYEQLEITLSDKIASAKEPHFDLGQAHKITYTPEKLFEVTNKECTLSGTSLTVKADLKNNSALSQNYYFICAVYSNKNEMLYAYESSGTLPAGDPANINEQITVPDTAASAKLFIWNGADTMKTIYQ